ncbi:MAG: hypothetical protein M3N48_03390 [Verrucomicrobiota bacterium]|nr:hypothetical protein [Verrucomicrobiota bacterium]
MKSLCVVLLLGLSIPGCSMFTKSGRMDRAYYKQLKQVRVAREKQRKRVIQKQTRLPSADKPPPLEQNVPTQPENQ